MSALKILSPTGLSSRLSCGRHTARSWSATRLAFSSRVFPKPLVATTMNLSPRCGARNASMPGVWCSSRVVRSSATCMSSASTVQARMVARIYDSARKTSTLGERVGSLRGAPGEAARTPLAPPAGLLLPLLGHVDQHLLAALVVLARAHVGAVGVHLPGAVGGDQLGVDHLAQLLAEARILDRRHHLHPALQVPLHAVGGADEVLLLAGVAEVVDAPVLEEPADAPHHARRLRQTGNCRPQPARVAYDQVDLHAGLRRAIERAGDGDVLQRVH